MTLEIVLSHVYCWPEVRRGAERYLHELGSALADRGHGVTVLSSAPSADTDEVLGVRTVRLARRLGPERFDHHGDEVGFGVQALAWVGRRRVDVWHALGAADAAAACLLSRTGRLRSVHTSMGLPSRSYWEDRTDGALHHQVVRHVDRYVCLSQTAARMFAASYGRRPDVVPAGVDLARFSPSPRYPNPVLLYAGSLVEGRKFVGSLLAAAAALLPEHPNLEVWLSGPGDPGYLLEQAPPEVLDHVRDLGVGSVDEQPARYGAAWVTVLPSIYEAFGLTLLESLACGTPIVARADGGGAAELVRRTVGAIAAPGAAGLVDACRTALALASEPSTVAACREHASHYDWRGVVAPALEALYAG